MNPIERTRSAAVPAADAHYDLGLWLQREHAAGRRHGLETQLLPQLRQGNVKLFFAAVFIESFKDSNDALHQAEGQIAAIREEVEMASHAFALCRNGKEIAAAQFAGKIAVVLSTEGAEPFGCEVAVLDRFCEQGVRVLGIAHTRKNLACTGAPYTAVPGCGEEGLTDFGKALLLRGQELGMLLDLSHLNDRGTADALALGAGPILASHSNCRAVCSTPRSLPDDLIRAIARRNGVIGLGCCSPLVGDTQESISMETLLRHLEHLLQIAGEDHVCLGLDLAEMICPGAPFTVNGHTTPLVDVIKGYGALPEFWDLLRQRGWPETLLQKIGFSNLMRVTGEVLG